MPRVPTYDSFQAAPNSLPQTRLTMQDMPDVAGQQAQQMGQSLQRAGSELGKIALDMQQQANQVREDDAFNQLSEAAQRLKFDKDAGFTNAKGINALQRDSGKPLADEYVGNLREQASKIADGLGNDAQRQGFMRRAGHLMVQFHGDAMAHEANEFKSYALSVREGTISNRMNEIGLNYNNPQAIDEAITSIQASVYEQGRLLGKSAEWQESQARKMTSNAHKFALSAAIEKNDVAYADAYLKKYSGQMDFDDLLHARGLITKEMDSRVALSVAGEVMSKAAPKIATSEAERAFNIAVGTESGGRQFGADGKPLTSPKGAIGIAQVMPSTGPEAAKLAGQQWDEERYRNDPAYNKALGLAYFQKQLQDNGGDLAKAYAAYNAGPGALQQAIKKADKSAALAKNDPNVQPLTWLDFMPQETKDYVAKNVREFQAGQGSYQKPTLADLDEQLRADPRLAASPERYKAARAELTRQYEEMNKAIKQREDETVVQAQDALVANGGNFNALPASLRAAIPRGKYDEMLTYAGKIAAGQPVTTDWSAYTQLRAMAANDPAKFGATDLRLFYPNLAPAQREQLVDLQMKAKDPKQQPDVVSLSQQLATAHRLLGFREGEQEKKGRFDDAAAQAIAAEVRNKKRDLTFEERDQIIKRLMLPTTAGGWFGKPRLYEVAGTAQETTAKPKVSDDDRKLIVAALKAEGIQATENNIAARFNLRFGIR